MARGLVERSERATRPSVQSVCGILTEAERRAVLEAHDPEFQRDMELARAIMKKRWNVFRKLAKL